jgi:spermidine synthase
MSFDTRYPLILACFVLSGVAGLIYQTAWLQQFALVFGTSELALVTVLASYMAGLALGATVAGRLADRVTRPVRLYAILELGIAATALLVPAATAAASQLQVLLLQSPGLPQASEAATVSLFYLVSSWAILLVPTGLMGATLPLLVRWAVRSEEEIGRRIGVLYTANTLGAAAGALLGAFALLPTLGLRLTTWVAASINVFVFLLAALLARRLEPLEARTLPSRAPSMALDLDRLPHRTSILILMAVSGVVSFTWEVLWTRLLSQLVGGSVYAFATMLATTLLGIALGAALAARLATTAERAKHWFVVVQIGVAGLSLTAFSLVDRLPSLATELARQGGGFGLLVSGSLLSGLTLLPGAMAIGATYPLAVRILARSAAASATASARVYAWNTLGAIAGALAAGYIVLPNLGFAWTATAAAAASLGVALAASLLLGPARRSLVLSSLAALTLLPFLVPETPWGVLRHSPLTHQQREGEVTHAAVGRSATVMLFESPFSWSLTTNGLPESIIAKPLLRADSLTTARWLSLLAVAARPEMESLLVVGLGAGVTIEGVPKSVDQIDVIELESEVVHANRLVASQRRVDPLADPRVSVYLNDARGALRLTARRFDAIVSQPSHPWTSGASHLFTREFLELVANRLHPNGVFVQWMGLKFVDDGLLRSMVATARSVFDYVELYQPGNGGVLLLASTSPLDVPSNIRQAAQEDPEAWANAGATRREDIQAIRVLDDNAARRFAAEAPVVTDAANLFQTRSPKVLGVGLSAARARQIWAAFFPPLESLGQIDPQYLGRRLVAQGQLERAEALAAQLSQVDANVLNATIALARGDAEGAEFRLRTALAIDPTHQEGVAALLDLLEPAISAGREVTFANRFHEDPELAIIAGWRARGRADWLRLRELEPRLADVATDHPLSPEAIRLRAWWRIASGDPREARSAVTLAESLLVPTPNAADLLLHAAAATAAGDPQLALSTLNRALPFVRRGSDTASDWHRIFRRLPKEALDPEQYASVSSRFRRPPPEDAADF